MGLRQPCQPSVRLRGIVLDISYRKNINITVYTPAVLLGCFGFSLIWFCKYQAFVFSSIAITNLLALKEFLDAIKL